MRSLWLLALVACGGSPPRTQPPRTPQALTPEVALARIESLYRAGVQRCYQSWLKRDPQARGDVVVTFTVDIGGKLARAHAKGVHPTVEGCVERAMARWSFPPPREEMTIRLALRLSSRT